MGEFTGTVYYRQRGILVLTPTFVVPAEDRTLHRPVIRVMLAGSGNFALEFPDGRRVEARALMTSPLMERGDILAENVDFALFDFAVASPEYVALQPLLESRDLRLLDPALFAHLMPTLKAGQAGTLTCTEVTQLAAEVVQILTGRRPAPLEFDARVMAALDLIEQLPLAEIKLPRLAQAVNLSPDRFRHLFRASTGATVSQYARSTAVWRALMLLSDNRSITEASHAAGFHDVSHFYRAYADLFGISLSEKNNIRKFRRVRCF